MGSSRLPGKVLRPINGTPLLGRILDRLGRLQHSTTMVVATTVEVRDDAIVRYCGQREAKTFRGSETKVLDRYHQCATAYGFEHIIRLTADNPYVDIEELDRLIDLHLSTQADLSHSFSRLPIGVGAEIFRFSALARCAAASNAPHHFEHVDEYMLEHPELFKTVELEVANEKRHPRVRLTVDDETDFRRACFIAEHAGVDYVTTEQAIALCSQFA